MVLVTPVQHALYLPAILLSIKYHSPLRLRPTQSLRILSSRFRYLHFAPILQTLASLLLSQYSLTQPLQLLNQGRLVSLCRCCFLLLLRLCRSAEIHNRTRHWLSIPLLLSNKLHWLLDLFFKSTFLIKFR